MARYSRVNEEIVEEIREAYNVGMTIENIAKAMDLSYSTVYRIIKRIGAYSADSEAKAKAKEKTKAKEKKSGRKKLELSPSQIHQALKLRDEGHSWRMTYSVVNPSMSFPSFYNILTKETWDKKAYKEWAKKIYSDRASNIKIFDAHEEIKEKSTPDIKEIKDLIEKLKMVSGAKEVTLNF